MSFNSWSEPNPYARVYKRQQALYSRLTKNRGAPSRSPHPPARPLQSNISTESLRSGQNPYETLLRDTTQHHVGGGLSASSARDIRLLPDEFQNEHSRAGSWREHSRAVPSTLQVDHCPINKGLLSDESFHEFQTLSDPFQPQQEPRTASLMTQRYLGNINTELAREIEVLPEQFNKIISQPSPGRLSDSGMSNPMLAKTMNKRVLNVESQEDLNRVLDDYAFPHRPSSYSTQPNPYLTASHSSAASTSYFNTPRSLGSNSISRLQDPLGSLGASSQWDIRMLPDPFQRSPQPHSCSFGSYVGPTANKRFLSLNSLAELRAHPDPFPIYEGRYDERSENSNDKFAWSSASERGEQFNIPRSAQPVGRVGGNQCLNRYAASSDSIYDLDRLLSEFGDPESYERCFRDYSRQSIEDLRRMPDPLVDKDDPSLCTARQKVVRKKLYSGHSFENR